MNWTQITNFRWALTSKQLLNRESCLHSAIYANRNSPHRPRFPELGRKGRPFINKANIFNRIQSERGFVVWLRFDFNYFDTHLNISRLTFARVFGVCWECVVLLPHAYVYRTILLATHMKWNFGGKKTKRRRRRRRAEKNAARARSWTKNQFQYIKMQKKKLFSHKEIRKYIWSMSKFA